MYKIYSHFNPAMVQLVKNELDQKGIESVIQGEHLAAVVGGGAGAEAWHELWLVNADRLDDAQEVVREVIAEDADERAEPWNCPQCGEEVEGTFAVCWNCGQAHPAASGEERA